MTLVIDWTSHNTRTSIEYWSKTAGAGGIGSMRLGLRSWKELRRKREKAERGPQADPQPVPPWEWRKRK